MIGGSVRFHKLWFDEVELEGAYMGIDKEQQGVQRNIRHIENKGNTTPIKHYYSKVDGYNTNIYLITTPEAVSNTINTLGYNAGIRHKRPTFADRNERVLYGCF